MPPAANGSDWSGAIDVVPASRLGTAGRSEVLALCDLAYGESLENLFDLYVPEAHVIARLDGRAVAHAMWVTRWLQVGEDEPIRTAYIEFVATHPDNRCLGLGSAVMRRSVDEIARSYRLAALCPAVPDFYARLGWTPWRGPLEVREPGGDRVATAGEEIMVMWLGGGDPPDVGRPLSIEWRQGEVW